MYLMCPPNRLGIIYDSLPPPLHLYSLYCYHRHCIRITVACFNFWKYIAQSHFHPGS